MTVENPLTKRERASIDANEPTFSKLLPGINLFAVFDRLVAGINAAIAAIPVGGGDVFGDAGGSTNNALVRWDGVDGDQIKDTTFWTLSPTGVLQAQSTGTFRIPQGAAPNPTAQGQMAWDTAGDQVQVGDGSGTIVLVSENSPIMVKALSDVLYFNVPETATTSVTEIQVFGNLILDLAGVTVDAGTPQNHVNPIRHNIAVEVTTLTSAGTLRFTGDSYDPVTQTVTIGDTEDIAIAAVGWFRTTKLWNGTVTVVLSSVGGLDVVLDSYNVSAPLATALILDGFAAWGSTTGGANQFRILVRKLSLTTGLTTILDQTDTGIPNSAEWADVVTGLAAPFAAGDQLLVSVFVQRVENVRVLLRFQRA